MSDAALNRRSFGRVAAGSALALTTSGAPTFGRSPAIQVPGPKVSCGVASGDVTSHSAVLWSRSDRPARMLIEWATNDSFRDAHRVEGPLTRPLEDCTAKAVLTGLPPGETIVYRVRFRDPDSAKAIGQPAAGRFRTPPVERAPIRFAWGGDVAGQGWGIDPAHGGMATFDAIRKAAPDFFLHSGDHIYADNPLPQTIRFADGSSWNNILTEETTKVAETIDEFRGRYRYNFLDDAYRKFVANVATIDQWDDHEVLNNWYPGERLRDDPRYQVKDVDTLARLARKAFLEYLPIRPQADDPARIYRRLAFGPNLDVFLLDQRSYRGANSPNRQAKLGPESAFLGRPQLDWLKAALKGSRATWKVIASDMPIGLVIPDGPDAFEAVGNGDGPPLGRELEIADLLASMKSNGVRNVVWLTADVHYAAAHRYDPSRARFTDFDPFWEFVAGPLHAGTFGPGVLDPTFGPSVEYSAMRPGMPQGLPPAAGLQFFGQVAIERDGRAMTVSLHDRAGRKLHEVEIAAS